jgi:hypothetical protein
MTKPYSFELEVLPDMFGYRLKYISYQMIRVSLQDGGFAGLINWSDNTVRVHACLNHHRDILRTIDPNEALYEIVKYVHETRFRELGHV